MDDLSFLEDASNQDTTSDAILWVQVPDGGVYQVTDRICTFRLLDNCPLLYHAFEYGHQSQLQASIEAPSTSAAISLLRYCYTGSYLPFGAEEGPIMFLPHAEIYKMAEDFDIPELQLIAHGLFSCQADFACSLPVPPHDLLETIRFVYRYFSSHLSRQQQNLLTTLLNYCIAMFEYHKLGESPEFLQVVREIPEFRQDLCHTNMQRNFEDGCAFDIIKICLDTLQPYVGPRPTLLASRDLPEAMLIDRSDTPRPPTVKFADEGVHIKKEPELDEFPKLDKSPELFPKLETILQPSALASPSIPLVFRPKVEHPNPPPAAPHATETDFSSDEDGFTLVSHPKDELMSSPELALSASVDILALTGSYYPSDDEWTDVEI